MDIEMKKCPECGELIPFNSRFCPICGKSLVLIQTRVDSNDERKVISESVTDPEEIDSLPELTTDETFIEESTNNEGIDEAFIDEIANNKGIDESQNYQSAKMPFYKKIGKKGMIISIVIAAAIIAAAIFGIVFLTLSDEEKYAVQIVEKYQNILKDPDSLTIRGDIAVIKATDSDGSWHRYCMFVASANNSYGASVKSTVIYMDGQYVDFVSDPELDDFDSEDEYLEYLDIYLVYLKYLLYGEETSDDFICKIVNGKTIARRVGAASS